MKKHISILVITAFFFYGCDILDEELSKQRSVSLLVQNTVTGSPSSGSGAKTSISYYDENGNTLFKDIDAGSFWTALSNDFTKGDRVFLGVNTPYKSGSITLRISCDKCTDLGGSGGTVLIKTIDLSLTKVANLSATLD
tara:strand:+ start:22545 stop:22961 length:417 start_codon:yes stop_codon:yes gene_type:complete